MPQSRLKKAVVLIPLTYNDGSSIPEKVREDIYDELFDAYDGWAIEGTVRGAYRMRSGEKRVEHLVRISIVLRQQDLPELERRVSRWGGLLGQETMLLEITDAEVKFIRSRRKRRP